MTVSSSGNKRQRASAMESKDGAKKAKKTNTSGSPKRQAPRVTNTKIPVVESVQTKQFPAFTTTVDVSNDSFDGVVAIGKKASATPYNAPYGSQVLSVRPTTSKPTTEGAKKAEVSTIDSPTTFVTPKRNDAAKESTGPVQVKRSFRWMALVLVTMLLLVGGNVLLGGLLLKERMHHELVVLELREQIKSSKQVPPAEMVEHDAQELQRSVEHWKGVALQHEAQKQGLLKEFQAYKASSK